MHIYVHDCRLISDVNFKNKNIRIKYTMRKKTAMRKTVVPCNVERGVRSPRRFKGNSMSAHGQNSDFLLVVLHARGCLLRRSRTST